MNCTLKDLYDFIHFEGESLNGIKVKTRYGYRDINGVAITAKDSRVHNVVLASGKNIKTSPDHLLWKDDWIKVKSLKIGDYIETEHGLEEIVLNELLGYKDDLYDIEVDVVHEFFANNIVSHNSTMSDVIKFGLYGRVDNKKLRDLPNRFNNNMLVKIVIEKNPTTIATIERGIAPNVFKLSINGIEYDQAGKKNVQEYIEDEILGIPFYVFNNMVSLSINDFKSFISMGAHDKRMIVDRLFGLEIIGHIRWKIKYKIKMLKEYIDNITTEIDVLERGIQTSYREMENLNEKLKVQGEEKRKDYQEKINQYEEFIVKVNEKIREVEDKDKELRNAHDVLSHRLGEYKTEHKTCKDKITLFEKGKCPECESDLTTDSHKTALDDFLSRNEEAQKMMLEINEKSKGLKEKIAKVKDMNDELHRKRASADAHISNLRKEISKLNESGADDAQTQSLENLIQDGCGKKEAAIQKKTLEEKKGNFFRIVEDIFGDKGVKLSALKRIIPLLNAEIRKVLADLNMDYRVTFNEEFDVDIQHLGFKVSPEQLSTGERKKVDFAALIALIRLMKIRFAGLNLTFLDEIFSSCDSDSIFHIVKILHKTCRELNLNIFVINHSQLPTEIFDFVIEVSKNNGFSTMNIRKYE